MSSDPDDLDKELAELLQQTPVDVQMCQLKPVTEGQTNVPCDNAAAVRIELVKPCSHISTLLICESCWNRTVMLAPVIPWRCKIRTEDVPCDTWYLVKDAIASADRIVKD